MTGRTRQGKCTKCRVRWVWPDKRTEPRVREAHCPECGTKLKATTHLLNWPVKRVSRVLFWNEIPARERRIG